jgi:hypothetical protein
MAMAVIVTMPSLMLMLVVMTIFLRTMIVFALMVLLIMFCKLKLFLSQSHLASFRLTSNCDGLQIIFVKLPV